MDKDPETVKIAQEEKKELALFFLRLRNSFLLSTLLYVLFTFLSMLYYKDTPDWAKIQDSAQMLMMMSWSLWMLGILYRILFQKKQCPILTYLFGYVGGINAGRALVTVLWNLRVHVS